MAEQAIPKHRSVRKVLGPYFPRARSVAEKLIAYSVATEAGCREWTHTRTPAGYGNVWQSGKRSLAHRLSFETFIGPIPDGLQLDHTCRNRLCINPAHLEPVTNRENTLRGVGETAQNAAKTHCIRGHDLSGPNMLVRPNGTRRCRVCQRMRQSPAYHSVT